MANKMTPIATRSDAGALRSICLSSCQGTIAARCCDRAARCCNCNALSQSISSGIVAAIASGSNSFRKGVHYGREVRYYGSILPLLRRFVISALIWSRVRPSLYWLTRSPCRGRRLPLRVWRGIVPSSFCGFARFLVLVYHWIVVSTRTYRVPTTVELVRILGVHCFSITIKRRLCRNGNES